MRRLEIGPGRERLPGFETLNLVRSPVTDHVGDARRPPFADGGFDEVYSSHCIEHVEWYEVEATICEWARILRSGGVMEVHTVDGERMMRAMLGDIEVEPGDWKRDLHRGDAYTWSAGRLLNYVKRGVAGTSWMHRAILTPAYLRRCMEAAGIGEIEPVAEPRGEKKHRGVNMGLRGVKC